jgi:hypothetical protein
MKILLELEHLGNHTILLRNTNGDTLTISNEDAIDFLTKSEQLNKPVVMKSEGSDVSEGATVASSAVGANCCPAKGWHKGQRFHPPFVFGGRGNST